MEQEKIGAFLKKLREEKGWTQEELAEKLYIRRQSISKWEIGKTCPDSENFKMLSEIFNVSIDELMSGEHISKKDALIKSEELKIKILDDSNAVKNKNRLLRKIIVALLAILFFSFIFYYFIMTYNKFKMYYITGTSDGISISDGYIFETNEKIFFQLGNININEEEVLSTTVFYLYNGESHFVYYGDNYNNGYIQDDKNYPEYFHTKVDNLIDNIYVKIKTKEKEYTIKLDYRLDYINNKLFFNLKNNGKQKEINTSLANNEYQQLYNLLSEKNCEGFTFYDDDYQYEVNFIKSLEKIDVILIDRDDVSFCTYSYSFGTDELHKNIMNNSYDKCEKNDFCYTQWKKIINTIMENLKKK